MHSNKLKQIGFIASDDKHHLRNTKRNKVSRMKFLHTMVRVLDLEKSLDFYVNQLGLIETRRVDVPKGEFSLIFLATEIGGPESELTNNWESTE